VYLCVTMCVCMCVYCVYICVCHCLCMCVSLCVCMFVYVCVTVCMYVSLCMCVSLCVCVCHCVYVCVTVCVHDSVCHCVYIVPYTYCSTIHSRIATIKGVHSTKYVLTFSLLTQAYRWLEGIGLCPFTYLLYHCLVSSTLHLFCHGVGQLQYLLYLPVW